MLPKYLLLIVLLFFSLEVFSQKYLLLDKIGSKRRLEFHPGDELTFKLHGESHFSNAVISHLSDSTIFFQDGLITLKNIDEIRIGHRASGILGTSRTVKFKIAGVGLILLDQFNTGIISGEKFTLNRGVLIAGGSLIALGYILDFAQKKRFKIRGNRRLRIVDVSFK